MTIFDLIEAYESNGWYETADILAQCIATGMIKKAAGIPGIGTINELTGLGRKGLQMIGPKLKQGTEGLMNKGLGDLRQEFSGWSAQELSRGLQSIVDNVRSRGNASQFKGGDGLESHDLFPSALGAHGTKLVGTEAKNTIDAISEVTNAQIAAKAIENALNAYNAYRKVEKANEEPIINPEEKNNRKEEMIGGEISPIEVK